MPLRRSSVRLRRRLFDNSELFSWRVEVAFQGSTFSSAKFESDDEAREFWLKNRDLLMEWWFDGVPGDFPEHFGFHAWDDLRAPHFLERPCFWWSFDATDERLKGETENDYLVRLGLLTDREKSSHAAFVATLRTEWIIGRLWCNKTQNTAFATAERAGLWDELNSLGRIKHVRPRSKNDLQDFLAYHRQFQAI